jgi:hypothetical protein
MSDRTLDPIQIQEMRDRDRPLDRSNAIVPTELEVAAKLVAAQMAHPAIPTKRLEAAVRKVARPQQSALAAVANQAAEPVGLPAELNRAVVVEEDPVEVVNLVVVRAGAEQAEAEAARDVPSVTKP